LKQKLLKTKGFGLLKFWKDLGPGLTTGAADDDPSGIATYSQAGSVYGFKMLWLALFTFPLMAIVQEMCARVGVVTGRGLASNIKRYYPKWVLYGVAFFLFWANAFNIGADLGAMAEAVRLLFPKVSFYLLVVVFTIVILVCQILVSYRNYSSFLKYLTFILFAYILTAGFIDVNWIEALKALLIPSFSMNSDEIFLITAILGTTISPYLFFWQTSQEVEEQILEGKKTIKERMVTTKADISKMRFDVWSGMFVSNLVMFFIIVVCGATLFVNGVHGISTAKDAALALRPFAGDAAFLLFTIGIVGTGALAVPVLAGSSSYAISESLGFREGLYRNFREAHAFYGVIITAMIVGMFMNFIGINPIKALLYSSVFNGLLAPALLVFIVLLSSKEKIMGEFVNTKFQKILGWVIILAMFVSGAATILTFIV